jgi:quercetin dioxygenase-like cupin family protein
MPRCPTPGGQTRRLAPAIIHILEGEGELTVDGDAYDARQGTWVRMAPDVKHSLATQTAMQIALYLLPR